MLILAIDSSAAAASVALMEDDKLIGEFFVNTDFTHSRTLVPMIADLCKVTGKAISDIELVAVTNGPGSFTGVRIGVSVAKGLSFDGDINTLAVSTLESMAYNLISTDCVVCASMDARRDQVYNAMFRIKQGRVERLCDDRAISLDDLRCELLDSFSGDRVITVGDGSELTYNRLSEDCKNLEIANVNQRFQCASSVALCACVSIKNGKKTIRPSELLPSYLRLSQAERELKNKQDKYN